MRILCVNDRRIDDPEAGGAEVYLSRLVDGLRVVNSGLKPGEDVVINGLMRVRPGMKVLAKRGTMADSATLALSSQ